MLKKISLVCALVLGALAVTPGPAAATPTDGTINWRIWGYVSWWRTQPDGDTLISFKDQAGATIKVWPNSSGTDICGGSSTLLLSKDHLGFTEMNRIITTAGLAAKSVKIGYQAVSGTCYLKELLVQM